MSCPSTCRPPACQTRRAAPRWRPPLRQAPLGQPCALPTWACAPTPATARRRYPRRWRSSFEPLPTTRYPAVGDSREWGGGRRGGGVSDGVIETARPSPLSFPSVQSTAPAISARAACRQLDGATLDREKLFFEKLKTWRGALRRLSISGSRWVDDSTLPTTVSGQQCRKKWKNARGGGFGGVSLLLSPSLMRSACR